MQFQLYEKKIQNINLQHYHVYTDLIVYKLFVKLMKCRTYLMFCYKSRTD